MTDFIELSSDKTPEPPKAKVILFKESGKYYTEEEWVIPQKDDSNTYRVPPVGGDWVIPFIMFFSKDFRRIGNGKVLVESQEPWGYPHLL